MKTTNIPYNNKALLKWSAFCVERSEDRVRPYNLVKTSLLELVKKPGYEHFKDRLNWLYNNYSEQNYDLVWSELQTSNARRIQKCFQDNAIELADEELGKRVESIKLHFGEIPEWIGKLNDNQRQLLLDRAKTCYGLEPEYDLAQFQTKQLYTVPERYIKEYNEYGEPIYYNNEELYKAKIVPNNWQTLVGRVNVVVEQIKRLAEDAVIRDARWMSKFDGTDSDLRECREAEGDCDHNVMVPITDMQGTDSPYGLEVEFRDFLEPIYEDTAE